MSMMSTLAVLPDFASHLLATIPEDFRGRSPPQSGQAPVELIAIATWRSSGTLNYSDKTATVF
jgi:hypothetical protein